jgi:hypothetical protein
MSRFVFTTGFSIGVCVSIVACGFSAETPAPQPAFGAGTSGTASAVAGSSTQVGGTFSDAGTFSGSGTGFVSGGAFTSAGSGGADSVGGGGTPTGGTATAGASGSAGTSSGGSAPATCAMPVGTAAPLPLSVSFPNFVASGHFGAPLIVGMTSKDCLAADRPAANTLGECFENNFQATMLDAGAAYGGIYWQHGDSNWGDLPGLPVEAGATKVTFKAWKGAADAAVMKVHFSAGGISSAGKPCADGVNLGLTGGLDVTLTTLETMPAGGYSIDLSAQTYPQGIIGGFVWSASVTTTTELVHFFVDEVQWVK